ncbi:MAG: endonuclease MutS2 [Eubacteriaceae bacterium]|jgi:DNA mismatch repair protein MutS2|nr:endonuclease MutS2 [Eubacteriaceae bacterium]
MNAKAIRVLEYDKIINMLSDQAGSEMTKKIISELQPSNDIRIVRDTLDETTEAVSLITHKGPLPLGNFYDIGDFLELTKKGGSLNMGQLLRILYNLSVARSVTAYMKGDIPELPILESITEVVAVFKDLEEDIDRCIISEDEMADNASSELRTIRRSIQRQNEAIKVRMDHIVNSEANRPMLQDSIVTMRDGRYVIPVKAEHKAKFPGIVHDQSQTGATVFIEPQAIVNLNNELRELEIAEKKEIDRILADLSARVAEHYASLKNNQELLVQLDLIMAKGKLASVQQAEMPEVSEKGELDLKLARHPLIDQKKVVPIDVRCGKEFTSLIITGPNTGGKTVTLKTVGLLCMMAQTGLHIPASSGSRIPVFDDVFADIGDEQSIEQSLSTFSSHMTNIVEIVENARPGTLTLLDELGAGTDPAEGAALAISILEDLRKKGATVLATTHYTELKKYALTEDGVENASMEFDVETLSPTYKLSIGLPGKSNAFEISKKLGLPGELIDRSKMLMDTGDIEFEDVIASIDKDRKLAEEERDEAIRLNIAMKKEQEEWQKKQRALEEKQENILNDAKRQAREIISEAKEVSKEVQEDLRELSKIESLGERNKKFDADRKKIKDAAGRYREKFIKEVNDNPVSVEDIKIGDRVKVMTLNENGEIISLPDDRGKVSVQVGPLKVRVDTGDLKLILEGKEARKRHASASYGNMYRIKAKSVPIQVDVRGQNLDEALVNVEKYLDDVFMAGVETVTIIHGRGEGILKKGIHDLLKKSRRVESFRKGGYNEGGEGVTIVTMKK